MNARRFLVAGCIPLLAACAGGPPPPDWQANAHAALAAHTAAWLSGQERVARQELDNARRAVARTGDAEQMARVELTACAARVASLGDADCPEFMPLARDAGAAANAYADYLAGRWQGLDAQLLPAVPGRVLGSSADSASAVLNGIDAPLSRLVAAATLLRAGRLAPQGIALAIDTAAQQGWRRPLLAWLGFDRARLMGAGDTAAAAAQQRRIERITGLPAK